MGWFSKGSSSSGSASNAGGTDWDSKKSEAGNKSGRKSRWGTDDKGLESRHGMSDGEILDMVEGNND